MSEMNLMVDINHATVEELAQVPGLGEKMAMRIVSERPFESVDDLSRVPGIGVFLIQRVRPYLAVSLPAGEVITPPQPGQEQALPRSAAEEPLVTPFVPPVIESKPAKPSKENQSENKPGDNPFANAIQIFRPQRQEEATGTPAPKKDLGLSRTELMTWGAGAALVIMIISVLVSLGILRSFNGGLNYPLSTDFNALQNQVAALETQINTQQQDLSALQSRLEAFEAISGRVNTVESDNKALHAQINEQVAQLKDTKTQLDQVKQQMAQFEERSAVFSRFIDGLRILVGDLSTETNTP